eukprot:gene5909-539_t
MVISIAQPIGATATSAGSFGPHTPSDLSPEVRKAAVVATLNALGDFSLQVWTDGSVEDGVRRGGAAAVFATRVAEDVVRRPAGQLASSYQAELVAIEAALQSLARRSESARVRVLLATDSLSAVQRLAAGPDSQTQNIANRIWELFAQAFPAGGEAALHVQWVAAHAGCDFNEKADAEAKRTRELNQEDVPIPFETATAVIRRAATVCWHTIWRQRMQERGAAPDHWYYKILDWHAPRKIEKLHMHRRTERILCQLRVAKCPWTDEYWAFKGRAPRTCHRCQRGSDTVLHLVCECQAPAITAIRAKAFAQAPTVKAFSKDVTGLIRFINAYYEAELPITPDNPEPPAAPAGPA